MYPENPEGSRVMAGSLNMGYVSDTTVQDTNVQSIPSTSNRRFLYVTVTG